MAINIVQHSLIIECKKKEAVMDSSDEAEETGGRWQTRCRT